MRDFKFYHGTSSLFVPSILAYGLGAINPSIDHKTHELLKFLFELSEKHLLHIAEYIEIRKAISYMVSQETATLPDRKEHYRYDYIHVSLSKYKAIEHAILHEHGSEVIDRCIVLYRLLEKSKITLTIPGNYDKYKLKNLAYSVSNPLVFEISNLSDGDLIN